MDRIIRQDELSKQLGVTRQTLYVWERNGQMPKRFKLAKNSRAAGWLSSDIEKWLKERAESVNEPERVEK